MPVFAATGRTRRQIRFPSSTTSTTRQNPKAKLQARRIQRTSLDKSKNKSAMAAAQQQPRAGIPTLFTEPPALQDSLVTETTTDQNKTVEKCLPYLKGINEGQQEPFNQYGLPALDRDAHLAFLYDALEDYPATWAGLDASRPWMVYWGLAALSMLGEDVSQFRDR